MRFIFVPKVAQRTQYRVGRCLSQATERAGLNVSCQLVKHINIFDFALALSDIIQGFQHLFCPQAAEGALTTGLPLSELQEVASYFYHTIILIKHHHAP
ncbi:hypothetical protein ES703_79124 [subsurface metagenome]